MSFLAIIILVVSGCQSSDRQTQGQSILGQLPIRDYQRFEPKELTKKSQQSTKKRTQLGSVNSESTDYKEQLYLFNSFNKNLRNGIQSNNRGSNSKGSGVGAVSDKNKASKIGILLPLSGNGEEDGRAFLDAMQLAFFEVANKNLKL
jgi:hypothetical protein